MKNISVGKKMLMGFGAVILMIVLIISVTTITSITRNSDLERATTMSDLQREANQMLDNFNMARIDIRTVFTSIHTETEFNAAVQYLAACNEHIKNMESLSAQLDGYMQEDITTLRRMFADVEAAVQAVRGNDQQAVDTINTMVENGTLMASSMSELSTIVLQTITNIGASDTDRALERVENVLPAVFAMDEHVTEIRIASRNLMLNQDTSVIPELYEGLDALAEEAAVLRGILSTDEARTATDTAITSIDGFRSSITQVEGILASSDQEIATARQIFDELFVLVGNYVSTISDDVHSTNGNVMSTSRATMLLTILIGAIAAAFSILVAVYLSNAITRPLVKMKNIMAQAGSTGNLLFEEEVKEDIRKEGEAKDELGQSLNAFSQFVGQITYMAECLKSVANRDLSVDVHLQSEEDTMGVALRDMLDNLNEVFAEINNISKQVAASSHEVAVGAQTLAQGSTEQAATVQEISASVVEINEQMNYSSEVAGTAANQGAEIGQIANEGNEKMNHLIGSMTEINDASQAIGRVIKVIDDIAFQTNILALNAAVEAARAGQHGKGFAVVADEVRNLASKSAAAAKETADLISTNIEKTEQGLSYTHDTAGSLEKIILGIEQTNTSLIQVAEQSRSTKAATAQVTSAIDQVSMVVQQNSATSEESAAASEEMSGQAQILQEYIARFKLRGQRSAAKPAQNQQPIADESAESFGMALSFNNTDKY